MKTTEYSKMKALIEKEHKNENARKEALAGYIESRINHLKEFLSGTDYKVIKCYEASLANEDMPYDLQALLAERKAWRDEMDFLEEESPELEPYVLEKTTSNQNITEEEQDGLQSDAETE
jgi:hypothetical protein